MTKSRLLRSILGVSIGALLPGSFAQSHSVSFGLSASDLVDLLVPTGSGITVVGSPILIGVADPETTTYTSGSFLVTGSGSGIPFSNGVILATGDIRNSFGPNDNLGVSSSFDAPGSALLESTLGLEGLTHDAVTLSFQFTSATASFSFQYMFGSEEYNPLFQGEYNDAFAFILDGPGASQLNLAKVPSSSTDVGIGTVNAFSNSEYFFDNNAGGFDIQYNGLVGSSGGTTLSATGNVAIGEVYTLSIVLADVLDPAFDSGLFLRGGSFVADGFVPPGTPVPEPATWIGAFSLGVVLAARARRNPRRL